MSQLIRKNLFTLLLVITSTYSHANNMDDDPCNSFNGKWIGRAWASSGASTCFFDVEWMVINKYKSTILLYTSQKLDKRTSANNCQPGADGNSVVICKDALIDMGSGMRASIFDNKINFSSGTTHMVLTKVEV